MQDAFGDEFYLPTSPTYLTGLTYVYSKREVMVPVVRLLPPFRRNLLSVTSFHSLALQLQTLEAKRQQWALERAAHTSTFDKLRGEE